MAKSTSNRIIATPSSYARKYYLHVQEVGTLKSLEPHISKRHNLKSYLFFIILEGSGSLMYEGRCFSLSAGDCAWLNCQTSYAHESNAEDPWTLMWVHFYGETADFHFQSYIEQENSFIFHPSHISLFTDCLHLIFATLQAQETYAELLCHKYITDLITLCHTESRDVTARENSSLDKLRQIRQYIDTHFAEKLSLDLLAEAFFISKFHLSREYKKTYGITIGNDLVSKRISHAKSLLRFTAEPVEQVANACGFPDSAYFIKVFKKEEGMTPLKYRHKW